MPARKLSSRERPRLKILIVEDHPIVREGLALTVGKTPDLVVCGQAETALEALKVITGSRPDLVLADLTLPDKGGLELIKDLQAQHPNLPVLVLSMHDEWLFAERALRAGARGYIMKQASPQQLLEAIRQVARGELYVSEQITRRIIASATGQTGERRRISAERLTDRQLQILELIGKGMNTQQIARHLHVSPKTVAAHQFNLKERLDLANVRELIRYAVNWIERQ
jgi:DNA-binding NarL/FixJ family response regulator